MPPEIPRRFNLRPLDHGLSGTAEQTSRQSASFGVGKTTTGGIYPNCLYNTAAYTSGQVIRLKADTLVQGLPVNSYNCFAYAESFVTGALPRSLSFVNRQFVTITPKWLGQHNYAMIAAAKTLDQLSPARLGDLVMGLRIRLTPV